MAAKIPFLVLSVPSEVPPLASPLPMHQAKMYCSYFQSRPQLSPNLLSQAVITASSLGTTHNASLDHLTLSIFTLSLMLHLMSVCVCMGGGEGGEGSLESKSIKLAILSFSKFASNVMQTVNYNLIMKVVSCGHYY